MIAAPIIQVGPAAKDSTSAIHIFPIENGYLVEADQQFGARRLIGCKDAEEMFATLRAIIEEMESAR